MGEGKPDSTNIGGLHWWYYYVTKMSSITYKGALYTNLSDGLAIPDIATMSFSWTVNGKTLTKPIGGFFVGLSVEGLMAMGMVASARDFEPPRVAVIEGFEVELKVFKSPDGRSVNTFYPIFRRVLVAPSPPGPAPGPTPALPPVEPPTVGSAAKELVRIIAAVANPAGSDEGREKVTLLNISAASVSLKGWRVIGPNRSSVVFGNVEVEGGEARTFVISARGSLQLSNKGGQVTLVDANERTVQTISYSPELARVQGAVLVWDMDSAFRQILA